MNDLMLYFGIVIILMPFIAIWIALLMSI